MAIRNYSVHRVRPLLPYGAILLFLGGVWVLWDGPSEGRQETIREQKMDTHSSAPVFSYEPSTKSEKVPSSEDDTHSHRAVYTLAAVQRHKPLGNLFAPIKGEEGENDTSGPLSVPEKGMETGVKVNEPIQVQPKIEGFIHGDVPIVILSDGTETKACCAGDFFAGWYVCYVNDHAVGLEQNGVVCEFSI